MRLHSAYNMLGEQITESCPTLRRKMKINPLLYFFHIKGQAALDRNPVPGYKTYYTLLLRLIPRDLYSACPNRYTLPSL